MKTYIVYQNGKLTMKEKVENKKKTSNFIKKKPIQQPSQPKPIYYQNPPQKPRSLIAPPMIEVLKNTHINAHSTKSQQSPKSQKQSLSGGKKAKAIKANELQLELFSKLCKIINIDNTNPIGKVIPFDTLKDKNVIRQLYDIQDKLKDAFPSSKLTALHSNAIKKQSFPGVNIVRQIYKEMGYKLRPVNTSEGYVGTKKILRREYHVEKL